MQHFSYLNQRVEMRRYNEITFFLFYYIMLLACLSSHYRAEYPRYLQE